VRQRLIACIAAFTSFARRYRAVATLGYTHFQTAQPTTVGKRATLWIQDLLLDLEDVDHRLATLRFRGVRGTTGTARRRCAVPRGRARPGCGFCRVLVGSAQRFLPAAQ